MRLRVTVYIIQSSFPTITPGRSSVGLLVLSVDWVILILQLLENTTLRIILRVLLTNVIYMHKVIVGEALIKYLNSPLTALRVVDRGRIFDDYPDPVLVAYTL